MYLTIQLYSELQLCLKMLWPFHSESENIHGKVETNSHKISQRIACRLYGIFECSAVTALNT